MADDEKKIIEALWEAINAETNEVDDGTGVPVVDHLPNQDALLNQKAKLPVEKHLDVMAYHNKIPPDTLHPYIEVDKWHCRHQTLVVVETKENCSPTFKERSTRFATSLNTYDTIKADVMSLSDGVWYLGLVYTGVNPGGLTQSAIEQQAHKWGYNQCVIVSYVGVI